MSHSKYTRKAVAYNPHWVNKEPAWDIALSDKFSTILKSVTKSDINRKVSRCVDVVRDIDIQEYVRILKTEKQIGE